MGGNTVEIRIEDDLHILIPVPSHNIPKTPPPAALNGSPKDLPEGETIPHPVPPGLSSPSNMAL
jgi:hypothetical protein